MGTVGVGERWQHGGQTAGTSPHLILLHLPALHIKHPHLWHGRRRRQGHGAWEEEEEEVFSSSLLSPLHSFDIDTLLPLPVTVAVVVMMQRGYSTMQLLFTLGDGMFGW